VGIEPKLYFNLDKHDVKGDKQEYTLKTSIVEKDFDYEIKVLSKSANIETWLEYYDEKTCEREITIGYTEEGKLLENGSYEIYKPIYETIEYDCSNWIRATKEEVRNKLNFDNNFTEVRVMREWGEMPSENCVYSDEQTMPFCKQEVDIILSFGGRKYIEYAQWEQTSGSWNIETFSNTEISGGKIVLTSSIPDYIGDLNSANMITAYHLNNSNGDSATVVENVGTGSNGAQVSSGNPAWTTEGKRDGALIFDGVNDNVAIDGITSFNGIVNTGTVQFWIKPNTQANNLNEIINFGGRLEILGNASGLGGCVAGRGCVTWYDGSTFSMQFDLPFNEWNLFTFTWDNTGHKLYVNRDLVDSDSESGDILWAGGIVYLGGSVSSRWWKGTIDELIIMDRLITSQEINDSYGSPNTDGYAESVGFGTGINRNWETMEYSGFSNVEISNSSDNSTWSDWVNVTHLADIGFQSNTAPSIPLLNEPNNETFFTSIPELNWDNSTDVDNTEGGISYYLEVDNNNDFSSPEYVNTNITETTNTTGDTPTGLSSDYYYWRVLAYDGSDNIQNSSWSEIRYFALTSKPHINIEYPKNTTYSDIGEIDFNWSSGSLLNIDTNWYSLNYGTNTTVTENITWDKRIILMLHLK